MRLLAIGHSYVLSVNRAVLRLLAEEHGFEVTVAAPTFYHGDLRPLHLEREPEASRVRVVGLSGVWTRSPHVFHYNWKQLRRVLREEQFDVVSVWEEPYVLSGWLTALCVRTFAPEARLSFYSCQNLSKRYLPPFSWFEKQTVNWADGWQASGELVYRALSARGYDPARGEVLGLAVDTKLFHPVPAEAREATLRSLGLESPVIGFVGRLTPEKGVQVLLKAFELLPRDCSWSALFLGSGPEQRTIEDWADKHEWRNRIRVKLAQHDEVPRYVAAMDLLAAPSQTTAHWTEQFGRMIVEAFASGVPVVASDSGEIPYVVAEGGIICPEADPAAWAREITGLLRDNTWRAELANRGLTRAEQFSAKVLAARYAAFYRKVARGNHS